MSDWVVLALAGGGIWLVFALLAAVAELLDRRALRREVWRAHQPRPFDWRERGL